MLYFILAEVFDPIAHQSYLIYKGKNFLEKDFLNGKTILVSTYLENYEVANQTEKDFKVTN